MWCIFCLTWFCQFTYTHTIRCRHIRLVVVCWCWSLLLPFATTVSHPLVPTYYRLLLSDVRFSCCLVLSAVPLCNGLFDAVGCRILMFVAGYSCYRLLLSTLKNLFRLLSYTPGVVLLLSTLHSCCCLKLFVPDAVCYCRPLVLGHCWSLLSTIRSCCRLIMSAVRSCSRLMFPLFVPIAVACYICTDDHLLFWIGFMVVYTVQLYQHVREFLWWLLIVKSMKLSQNYPKY